MRKIKLVIIAGALLTAVSLNAQEAEPLELAPAVTPVRVNYHQIFLDEPVQKVNGVNYFDDSGAIQFKLSPDGRAIYLLDYNEEGGVKAEVIDMNGAVLEVVRSKCKIHSLQEL